MFNKKQLAILDQLNPYIDGEDGESRKGQSQIYPLIHIKVDEIYWCDDAEDMIEVPDDLVGDWIVDELFDEYAYDTWNTLRSQKWQRAEYKEIKVMKWQVA